MADKLGGRLIDSRVERTDCGVHCMFQLAYRSEGKLRDDIYNIARTLKSAGMVIREIRCERVS